MWRVQYVDAVTGSRVTRWITSEATRDRIIADLVAAGIEYSVIHLADVPTTLVRPALVWDCPQCGERQFGEFSAVPLSSDDIDRLKEILPAEAGADLDGGDYLSLPAWVQCRVCGSSYRPTPDTAFFPELGDDEGDDE